MVKTTAEFICKFANVDINKLTPEQLEVVYFLADNHDKTFMKAQIK